MINLEQIEADLADKNRLPYGVGDDVVRELIAEVRKLRAEPAVLKEALTNSCDLLESYIDTFGDMSGANRADVNDYRAVLSLADERGL